MINDPIAAGVSRNQKIICTVIIEHVDAEEGVWHIYREGHAVLASANSESEARELADMYLEGYGQGYDAGKEAEDDDRKLAASDWAARKAREAKRNLRVSGRGPAFPSVRRD
jgi:hypothetical protein